MGCEAGGIGHKIENLGVGGWNRFSVFGFLFSVLKPICFRRIRPFSLLKT